MKQLVQWGAGNIGRSFIGQVFARNGWHVTFIDVDKELIALLNEKGSYQVTSVSGDTSQTVEVTGIRAIDANDEQQVIEAIVNCDIISTSVGKQILPRIAPLLAAALVKRYELKPTVALDLIIAENIHDGDSIIFELLANQLPPDFPLADYLGLIQTSIGKMVPIQDPSDKLTLIAEPFNTLVLDKKGFKKEIPPFAEIEAVTPISAYVDRKLYIHNLGHAVGSYIGFALHPEALYLADVLEDEKVYALTKKAMEEGSELLLASHPGVFTAKALDEYKEDLLARFKNKILGDTLFRIGRDLKRKLRYDDRLMGAILAAYNHKTSFTAIAYAYKLALSFKATDENGALFGPDVTFFQRLENKTLEQQILLASGLQKAELPQSIIDTILRSSL